MKTSTDNKKKLPRPPGRTIFLTDKDGDYHHTVTAADLGINVTNVKTGRFTGKSAILPESSE